MLRPLMIYLSQAGWARDMFIHFAPARRAVRRFVAGETLDEALDVTRQLNAKGMGVTLNYLGEHVHTEAEARAAADAYTHIVDRAAESQLDASVSVKLSSLGLEMAEEFCYELTRGIVERGKARDIDITIDMEDSRHTDATLRIYHALHDDCQCDNVGIVIQAYLYRTEADMRALADSGARVRLCKGAYKEPPEIAFPKKRDVDDNFAALTRLFLNCEAIANGAFLEVATHDERMIEAAKYHARQNDIGPEAFEFQMLYGVRPRLQEQLVQEGYRMRIYVPFGSQWYPYFMRRMAENPANLWFMVVNFFRA